MIDPQKVAALIVDTVKRALAPRDAAIDDLRRRVAALDGRSATAERSASTKPRVVHRGAWNAERQYAPDDAVLHAGRLWRSKAHQIRTEPGSEYGSWE